MMKYILLVVGMVLAISTGMGATYEGMQSIYSTLSNNGIPASIVYTEDGTGYVVTLTSSEMIQVSGAVAATAAVMLNDGTSMSFVAYPTSSSTAAIITITQMDAKLMLNYYNAGDKAGLLNYIINMPVSPFNL